MRRLLAQFVNHVYRFALRLTGNPHEAEDLTQDVMLRALRSARRLRDLAAARVWLFRITVNLWNDRLRRRRCPPRLRLSNIEPDNALADAPSLIDDDANLSFDPGRGTVIAAGSESTLNVIEALVTQLDRHAGRKCIN